MNVRTMCQVTLAVVLMVCASASVSAGPVTGYYESELSGDILEGVWSESYDGGAGQIGNTVHAASWDGTTLATQWELVDAAIDSAPQMLMNTVDGNGNGLVIWYTTYSGGELTLQDTGPWWNVADPGTSYTLDLDFYSHNTQVTYVAGQAVEQSTTVQMTGTFADYPGYEISFLIAQAYMLGEGDTLPPDYPAWQTPANADPGSWSPEGGWGIAQKIRMDIVPEPATMSLLVLGLGGLAIRRRRRS